jgi:hypothetical protein
MLADKIEAISRAPLAALDTLARAVWQDFGTGKITEAETNAIVEAIENRRRALRKPTGGPSVPKVSVVREGAERAPAANLGARTQAPVRGLRQLVLRIPRPATYDRIRSRERRRGIAASGMMPPALASSFTLGEQAALAVIATEVLEHHACDRCLDEIAARSGTSRSTVKRAIKEARALGLIHVTERPQPGAKHLPSIIRIVSSAWAAWLKHRTRRIGVQNRTATDTEGFTKGLAGNVARPTTEPTGQPYDSRESRNHRPKALRA